MKIKEISNFKVPEMLSRANFLVEFVMFGRRLAGSSIAVLLQSISSAIGDSCNDRYDAVTNWRPIRIKFSVELASKDNRLTQEILPSVASFLSRAVSIRDSEEVVRAVLGCATYGRDGLCFESESPRCLTHTIPESWYSAGGDGIEGADMVIFVTDRTMEGGHCSPGVNAVASACHHDACGRPVTATMTICDPKKQQSNKLHSSVLHEAFHALGFHFRDFSRFRDSKTLLPRVRSPKTVYYLCEMDKQSGKYKVNWNVDPKRFSNHENFHKHTFSEGLLTAEGGSKCTCPVMAGEYTNAQIEDCLNSSSKNGSCQVLFSGPAVVREARNFFACNSLAGVRLDDTSHRCGSLIGDHWHSDGMYSETMTPRSHPDRLDWVSPMTLALLEDSGWYRVNYDMATRPGSDLTLGFKKGCRFLSGTCEQRRKVAPENFCIKDSRSRCSASALYVERCVKEDSLCPRFVEQSGKGCFMNDPDSRCLYRESSDGKHPDCFKIKCNLKRTKYAVFINGKWSDDKCTDMNQKLKGSSVVCQDPALICKEWDLRHLAVDIHFDALVDAPNDPGQTYTTSPSAVDTRGWITPTILVLSILLCN